MTDPSFNGTNSENACLLKDVFKTKHCYVNINGTVPAHNVRIQLNLFPGSKDITVLLWGGSSSVCEKRC